MALWVRFLVSQLVIVLPKLPESGYDRLRCGISLEKHKLGTNLILFQMQTRLKFNIGKPFTSLSYLLFQEFGHFFNDLGVCPLCAWQPSLCVCCMTYTYMQHSTIALTQPSSTTSSVSNKLPLLYIQQNSEDTIRKKIPTARYRENCLISGKKT